MSKIIKIQKIAINKSLLEWMSPHLVTNIFKYSGYYVIASNNQVFVEKSWWEDEEESETIAIVNDMNLNSKIIAETSMSFDIDLIKESQIPIFGVTIDDNYNIQQFNLTREEISKDIGLSNVFDNAQKPIYWDIDKTLHIGKNKYSEKQFNRYISAIKMQGYANPVVLYVDKDFVRTYYYDVIPYLYEFIDCKTVPVRTITYKDIKYVNKISHYLYQELHKIPTNPYYSPDDNKDVSSMMVDNFSDKRNIIKTFMRNNVLDMNQKIILMDIDKLDEVLPYFFTEDLVNKNKEFIEKLLAHKYPKTDAFEEDHFMDNMSINESLYRYINGYAVVGESNGTENADFASCDIIEEKDFDPALYPFDSFDYLDYADSDMQKIVKAVSNKFGSLCVHKDCPTQIIDIQNIHEILKDKNAKVKILGEK